METVPKKGIRKLFGGLNLTWPRLLLAAVLAGVYTAAMALIPALAHTSFHTIAETFEVWVLFGILIIMNSRSNLDAALKCFVFFLISQPLVYLIQVPFSTLGWSLFSYYPYWLVWTVLCLPMGWIGYYMKKGKWWGYPILLPMIGLTAASYRSWFASFLFYRPRYLLICLFCACGMILYPAAIFSDRRIRTVGAAVGAAGVIILTVLGILHPPVYSTELLSGASVPGLSDACTASLADARFGSVGVVYFEQLEEYMVHADFKRAGKTVLTLEFPDGEKREYDLTIDLYTYDLRQRE